MLDYLVTSRVRYRLVLLLWGSGERGSASELAERADIAFGAAHRELKEMQRRGLVRIDRAGAREVFAANPEHAAHEPLRALARTGSAVPRARSAPAEVERRLVRLGAPLRGVEPLELEPSSEIETLLEGATYARSHPTVARALPLCAWNVRSMLDAKKLAALDAPAEDRHALGFMVELAGELGGDRRLGGAASVLRDARIKSERPFFFGPKRTSTVEFPLARKWGFAMNTDRDAFASLFHKFENKR